MIILPYSTALTLARPPIVSWAVVTLCALVFLLQLATPEGFTRSLMYYPDSLNPVNMVSSALAHGGWLHLLGNLLFFMAFAPAIEVLFGARLRFVWHLLLLSVVVSLAYSISVWLGNDKNLPTLGLSGVVMGVIGYAAYLMPRARVRVFWWYLLGGMVLYIPAWIVALFYIGIDAWTMLSAESYGGTNIVAHVAGGAWGYLFARLTLTARRQEVKQELDEEIEAMQVRQKHGKTREDAHRARKRLDQQQAEREAAQQHDRFMRRLYQQVKADRDSEAVMLFIERYGDGVSAYDLETLFDRVHDWGPSRFLLCLGRLIMLRLEQEKRSGRALAIIERCQRVSPGFLIADTSRLLFYAELALQAGKPGIARDLLNNPRERYRGLINPDQCNHWLQKALNQLG
jgi:membrane associated rhomboid family serine protease